MSEKKAWCWMGDLYRREELISKTRDDIMLARKTMIANMEKRERKKSASQED